MNTSTGVAFTASADDRQFLYFVAVFKRDAVNLRVAAHGDFNTFGQGVNHRDADAVQAARELIVFVGEFTARMQATKNKLDRRNALFRVDINRHTAPVINDF
ncbi:hypothetical protein D3C75_725250 [compost metagenome]